MIKPQFEAGREKVGKHGIVHDPKTHLEVVQDIMAFSASVGYDVCEFRFFADHRWSGKHRISDTLEIR